MDSTSLNHYEAQLYSVFKTFDVTNEEALNKTAVLDLCNALQLEERGASLVDTLFERRDEGDRVTFTQFRSGLLSVLGADEPSVSPSAPPPVPLPSDEDSSGREVAPKFVFGSKKYGRRSRPQHATADSSSPRALSASRLDTDSRRSRTRMKFKRSASAMETRDADPSDLDHDSLVNCEAALALCRGLRMEVDRHIVERIFVKSPSEEMTVGSFFDKLNMSLTSSIQNARETDVAPNVVDEGVQDDGGSIASDAVVEAWERAGVRRPRRLLAELGFTAPALPAAALERALDDELQALGEPGDRSLLPLAALALARLQLERAHARARLTTAERDKLRGDVAEANRRAGILAQDVDDNHARMEAELKASVRRMEARHADETRALTDELSAERDRIVELQNELKVALLQRSEAEIRLAGEADSLRLRGEELEVRVAAAEERASHAQRECSRLAAAATAAADSELAQQEQRAAEAVAAALVELRRDNQQLRDRCDELQAALESRRTLAAPAPPPAHSTSWRDESAATVCSDVEDCDITQVRIDQRAMESTELHKRLQDILEMIFEPVDVVEGCESCKALRLAAVTTREKVLEISGYVQNYRVGEGVGETRERGVAGTQTAADTRAIELEELRAELADTLVGHDAEKKLLNDLITELETSLEQVREEFDRNDEYWRSRLEEERAASLRELKRGRERAGGLPDIDERAELEAQYNHIHTEFIQYKEQMESQGQSKDEEISRLKEQVTTLQAKSRAATPATSVSRATPATARSRDVERLAHMLQSPKACWGACGCADWGGGAGGGGAGGGAGAAEVRVRLSRAERAVRRLHARLAAADLLVSELYIENCHLQHARVAPPAAASAPL